MILNYNTGLAIFALKIKNMGISDYNLSGDQQRNIDHFASIVRMALADEIVSAGEEKLLKRLAKRFHILEDKYKDIIENPSNYPVDAPLSYDKRIERLFDLSKMVIADDQVSDGELSVLRRVSVGLGFPVNNVDKIADEAVRLVSEDADVEDFTKVIKRVNVIS